MMLSNALPFINFDRNLILAAMPAYVTLQVLVPNHYRHSSYFPIALRTASLMAYTVPSAPITVGV